MNKETFLEWRNSPVTVEVFDTIEKYRDTLTECLSTGQTLCATSGETHGSTARVIGQIEGLSQLLNINYEGETQEEA